MATAVVSTPSDLALLREIRRFGKFDVDGCYQCGTCTLACELADAGLNIPRKSIRQALLGLREPLLGSLEPWICHDCGECSELCPRQAEPRISMFTLRQFLHAQYDWTGISGRVLRSKVWYVGALLVATLLGAGLALFYHWKYAALGWGDITTPLGLEHALPMMQYFTWCVVLVPLFLLASQSAHMWWLSMWRLPSTRAPLAAYLAEARTYFWFSAGQSLLRKCLDHTRWTGHWLMALGVTVMIAVKLFALRWFQTDSVYAVTHPQRWLGYLATGFILYGVVDILVARLRARKEFSKERRFEHFVFPVLLLLTALTGIAAHGFRYAGFELTCHYLYAAHVIVATPMLLVEIPFGHWSHMISRPLALYFFAVRERAQLPARDAAGVRDAA